jgi:hypothetical protein
MSTQSDSSKMVPEKLHEAMECLVPIAVAEAVAGANASACPIIMMPPPY